MDLPSSAIAKPTPANLDWRTVPIPRGAPTAAWLAGPPFVVWCHHNGAVSKPCLKRITKGALACPWCGVKRVRLIGYVPIITYKERAKRVVILSKTALPHVQSLPIWSAVHLSMPNGDGLPAVMKGTDDTSLNGRTHKELQKRSPEDIREYLIRVLWQVPELADHFGLELWTME